MRETESASAQPAAGNTRPAELRSSLPASCQLAKSLDELKSLHDLCRTGRLFEVEEWIREGRPLQISPDAIPKGRRPQTALQMTVKTGQHSLALLLLRNGYRLNLEPESPLNEAMNARRVDLVDILLEWGADPNKASLANLFDTYDLALFERFRAAGVDLTRAHALAEALAYHSSNKPLFGFVKRHRIEEPSYQRELDIALGYHAREGHEKGVLLCLWAGGDPHAKVPDLEYGGEEEIEAENPDVDDGYECAVEQATWKGAFAILARLRPNPTRVDFDRVYRIAANREVVDLLIKIQLPRDVTSIVQGQCSGLGCLWLPERRPAETLIGIFSSGIRWDAVEPKRLVGIRGDLLKADQYRLKEILQLLRQPEVCAPENFQELTRTPAMQKRMLDMGLIRPRPKVISKAESLRREVAAFVYRYDRNKLYEEVWSEPVQRVAKAYSVSGVYLGRVCRILRVPVPKRGYWARVQAGHHVNRPALRNLPELKGLREERRR